MQIALDTKTSLNKYEAQEHHRTLDADEKKKKNDSSKMQYDVNSFASLIDQSHLCIFQNQNNKQ